MPKSKLSSEPILSRKVGELPKPTKKHAFLTYRPGRICAIVFAPISGRPEGFFETDDDKVGAYLDKIARSLPNVIKRLDTEPELSWKELRKLAKELGMPNWNKAKKAEIEEYVAKNKS